MATHNIHERIKYFGLILCLSAFVVWAAILLLPQAGMAANGAGINMTLNTTVNITNAAPEVRSFHCPTALDLEAYGTKAFVCNVTVFDWDNDTLTVNGTFFRNDIANPDSASDNNYHYRNSSCARITPQDREMNYSCSFDVQYYADNSSQWVVNVTAYDDDDASQDNQSSDITVNSLVAIYVPGVLDFGEMAVNEISSDKLANITNAGNKNITISVNGWGATIGDGLAMNCTYGNIPLSYERYNHTQTGLSWATEMVPLSNDTTLIEGFTIMHRFDDASINNSTNSTYWKLRIPALAGGRCNGKILFTASDAGY